MKAILTVLLISITLFTSCGIHNVHRDRNYDDVYWDVDGDIYVERDADGNVIVGGDVNVGVSNRGNGNHGNRRCGGDNEPQYRRGPNQCQQRNYCEHGRPYGSCYQCTYNQRHR